MKNPILNALFITRWISEFYIENHKYSEAIVMLNHVIDKMKQLKIRKKVLSNALISRGK